jgi:hypothetical protein
MSQNTPFKSLRAKNIWKTPDSKQEKNVQAERVVSPQTLWDFTESSHNLWSQTPYAKKSARPGSSVRPNDSLSKLMNSLWENADGIKADIPGGAELLLGFLEGDNDSKSPALLYAPSYFGGPNPIPLNAQTYNAFNAVMYKAFLDGQIPGKVSYYQPSIDDLRATLQESGILANNIDFTQTPDARKRSFTSLQTSMLGPPGLSYAPQKRMKK